MYNAERLDTTQLKTVEDIEAINWFGFCDPSYKRWVRHIKYPVAQKELDRVCELSRGSDKVRFTNSMGDLYVRII